MTAVASTGDVGVSPRLLARIAGVFYLGTIVGGVFAELARETLIVSGNPAATAHNILASESLYRWAFAANLVEGVCYVVVTLLLYQLLKPVNRSVSLLAAFFSLVGSAVGSLSLLALVAPLFLLEGAHYLAAFAPAQLQAMAYVFLKLQGQGDNISLVFFGFYCLFLGYLIFTSTFLPRIVGILMAFAGFGFLVNSFANFLSPALADYLSAFVLYPGLLGEGTLTLWLVVVGVNVPKWEAKANRLG
jgi:hypothetical protein